VGAVGGRIALLFVVLAMATGARAQQHQVEQSIQFAEPVNLSLAGGTAAFDAYGRRFSMALVDNERVLQKLPAQHKARAGGYRLLRGSLEGTPGSWVRLTETPRGVEGAIWDGHELYAVTRHEDIAPYLTTPLAASPDQTVVYRLSDARNALPRDFCALESDVAESQEPTALDQYRAIVSALEDGVITPTVSRQIEISLIADNAFQVAEAPDPMAAMMARLNIVEGIFAEQVGLLILATDVRLMPASSDPFTSTKGTTLLEQLGTYRDETAAVRARGLAHLMTGKDLDGTTAGIAYVRTVCEVKRGVSLSQRSYGTTISALIMAHELGHNFGAEHDGVADTACAAVPEGFIMAPSVSGYSTFSQCSIDTMSAVLATASCVTPAQFADVTLETSATAVVGEGGRPFTLPFMVRSTGNLTAEEVTMSVTLPANLGLAIDSASSSVGTCSVNGLVASCSLSDLAAETSAQVSVVARGNAAVSFNAQGRVNAANDRLTSNNNRVLPVTLRSGIDAAVALTSSASEVPVGESLQLFADVHAQRALPVRNATLSLNLNQPVASASLPGGTCTINASSVSCTIAEIAAGTSRRLTVQVTAKSPGSLFASATVSVTGDGDFSNNSASVSAWVQAERDVELTTTAANAELSVGEVHEIAYTLRSRGPLPTGDVALLISLPTASVVVDSIDAGGVTCSRPDMNLVRCELGALAPGASRVVRLRVHGTGPVAADIMASALAADDGFPVNNNVAVQLRIDHVVDLAITLGSGGSGVEDVAFDGQVMLRSQGRESAVGASLDIELHAAGLLRAARIHEGATCTLLSATRARCALPTVVRNGQLYVNYRAEFAEPGDYDVRFALDVPNDTAPTNDTLVRAVLVRPFIDAAISGSLGETDLYGGQSITETFTLTADRRPLASTRLVAGHAGETLRVEAISAAVGDCRVDPDLGGVCDFGELAAFSSTAVSVTYRAGEGNAVVYPMVSVATAGDVASGNNSLSGRIETFAATDVSLRVGTAASGSGFALLTFPTIELVNGSHEAIRPRLEVTLPSQLSVADVSAADAVCSGTSTLVCEFENLEAARTATVSLSLRASGPGRFTSTVRISAANDNNPANDSREVVVEVGDSQSLASPAPSEAKGGGGRFEWLTLLLLALKWGHSSFPRKRGRT
jgi:hypothetical protein